MERFLSVLPFVSVVAFLFRLRNDSNFAKMATCLANYLVRVCVLGLVDAERREDRGLTPSG